MSHNPRHAVGITGLSKEFLRTTTVVLTDAQVKALPVTSITLVSAPGSGKAALPLAVIANRSFAAGAYTNIDGAATITVGTSAVDQVAPITTDDLTAFLGATASVPAYLAKASGATLVDNAAIVLRSSNASAGAFTGGNAANTLTVTVLFTVVDLA